jgi:predicted dithiol-disulfide oxidoreductase (DUF899 family)
MSVDKAVSRATWLEARQALLNKEKAATRLRDECAAARRAMPWVKVDKPYAFETPAGTVLLAELFGPHSQLLIYHFMLHPDWAQGCKACSFLADSYARSAVHLAARDVAFVTVSRAPLAKIESFRTRMGWEMPWVSSADSGFNEDFHVSFSDEERASGEAYYNYRKGGFPETEAPGISAFIRGDDGEVYHTYSAYGRGLDILMTTYQLLDMVPRGRNEDDLDYSMAWIRHHDRYYEESDGGFH